MRLSVWRNIATSSGLVSPHRGVRRGVSAASPENLFNDFCMPPAYYSLVYFRIASSIPVSTLQANRR
jgi:hypothetical protein